MNSSMILKDNAVQVRSQFNFHLQMNRHNTESASFVCAFAKKTAYILLELIFDIGWWNK